MGHHRIHLVDFPVSQDGFPSLPNVQCLENYYFICSGFFIVSGRGINMLLFHLDLKPKQWFLFLIIIFNASFPPKHPI